MIEAKKELAEKIMSMSGEEFSIFCSCAEKECGLNLLSNVEKSEKEVFVCTPTTTESNSASETER